MTITVSLEITHQAGLDFSDRTIFPEHTTLLNAANYKTVSWFRQFHGIRFNTLRARRSHLPEQLAKAESPDRTQGSSSVRVILAMWV
jgi:hypothetical protein